MAMFSIVRDKDSTSYGFSIVPVGALPADITVRWEIVPIGALPIALTAPLTGEVEFTNGLASISVDTGVTPARNHKYPRDFEIRLYNDATDDLLFTEAVRLGGDSSLADNSRGFTGGLSDNIIGLGSSDVLENITGGIGDDIFIVTRFQYGNVTINDSAGVRNPIKFDYGVEIIDFSEELSFFGIDSASLTLSTGAVIKILSPDRIYGYQLGKSDDVLDYAGFRDAIGVRLTLDPNDDPDARELPTPYAIDSFTSVPDISMNVDENRRFFLTGGNNEDIFSAASDSDITMTGGIGDDILIVTRFQHGDVTINDSAGVQNLVKFDYGIRITAFSEELGFFGIDAALLTLSTGAVIRVEGPERIYAYQLGDGDVQNYDDFKATIGVRFTLDPNDDPEATEIEKPYEVLFNTAPEFTQASYTVNLPENTTVGAEVFDLANLVTDVDAGDSFTYSIERSVGNLRSGFFNIQEGASAISLVQNLDFEDPATDVYEVVPGAGLGAKLPDGTKTYTLIVAVTDAAGAKDTAEVVVTLTDVNEAAPAFAQASYTESVSEAAGVGADLVTLTVSDSDTADALTYEITTGDTSLFEIVKDGSNDRQAFIRLKPGAALDYETAASHELMITVYDGVKGESSTKTGTTSVTINLVDVNEHDPQFADPDWRGGSAGDDALSRNFLENTATGTIAEISARDDDGTNNVVSYAITSGDTELFAINNDGVLTLKSALDYESFPNTYSLTITASDADGRSNTQTLTINTLDVDDVVPVLDSTGSALVTAGEAGVKTGLTLSVADADSSNFRFDIDDVGSTDFASKFQVVADGDDWVLKLRPGESLVYDANNPSFMLKIRVWDGANNSHDEDGVDDDADSVITALVEVQRSEAGAAQIHFVDGSNVEITAAVVGNTLNLAVKEADADGNGDFDLANAKWYRVTNAGKVEFSVTNNAYTPTLDDVGTTILVEIEYRDGNGNASVSSVRHVIADANDSPPTLSVAYTSGDAGGVVENALGAVIDGLTLNISDADHPSVNSFASNSFTITYAADDSDASGEFYIFTNDNGASWQLGLESGVALNYEDFTSGRVALKVKVNDGANDSTPIPVNVQIADVAEVPQLTAAVATGTIAENAAANTPVSGITLTLLDGDRGTASSGRDFQPNDFTITDTNGVVDSRFGMVKDGNDWKLAITAPFNFESLSSDTITVLVTASNGRLSSDAERLTVTVTDINEAPTLTASGNAASFQEQTFTTATDTGITFTVSDVDGDSFTADSFAVTGDALNRFHVVDDNGVWKLQIKKDSVLDFEAQTNPNIALTITLSDGALTDSEDVTITIGNVTEGYRFEGDFTGAVTDDVDAAVPPISGTVTRVINDDAPNAGHVAGVISVQNAQGRYGTLTYTASTDPAIAGTWEYTLDRTLAATRALKANEEATDSFTLIHPQVTQSITITVTGADNPFSFEQESYAFTIAEGDSAVGEVRGSDPDADGASTTDYDFVNAPSDLPFTINSRGAISVKNGVTLDYETHANVYNLQVEATADGNSITVPVQITLTDLPDEAVVFDDTHITWQSNAPNGAIAENTTGLLALLQATDPESGDGGQTATAPTYSVLAVTDADGNTISDHPFEIEAQGGSHYLALSTGLDFESAQNYRVTLRATSTAFDTLYDDHTLTITVSDANDAPIFITALEDSSLNYAPEIAETAALGVEVTRVRARDVDRDVNGDGDTITYAIASGNNDGHFAIDARTGIITLIKALNYDVEDEYTLTITATDNGTPPKTRQEDVVISITDADLPPHLAAVGGKTTGAVAENAENVATGIVFTITDADTTYMASDFDIIGTHKGNFEMKEDDDGNWALWVATGGSFDREQISEVNLQIAVAKADAIDVVVEVTDVDEALPTIPASYTFDVSEDAPIGTVLGVLRATDADDPNVSFTYTFGVTLSDGQILTVPGYGPFNIDYATGQIILNRAVDYDTAPADDDFMLYDAATKSYSIIVQASDNVNANIQTTVTINILGVDDETPVIDIMAGQSLTITENQVADVEIDFTASDADSTLTAADFFVQDVVVAGRESGIADKFEIVKNGANWRLKNKDGVVFDRDAYTEDSNGDVEFKIQVGVRDAGGNVALSEEITITLLDAADSGNPPRLTLIDLMWQ